MKTQIVTLEVARKLSKKKGCNILWREKFAEIIIKANGERIRQSERLRQLGNSAKELLDDSSQSDRNLRKTLKRLTNTVDSCRPVARVQKGTKRKTQGKNKGSVSQVRKVSRKTP